MTKTLAFMAFMAAVVVLSAAQPGVTQKISVLNLTRADLDEIRKGDWLLAIVAQWCPFSQGVVEFLPAVSFNLKNAKVAVIDGEEDPSVLTQFSVTKFPHICYIHDGTVYYFNGRPGWDDVMNWASKGWKSSEPLTGADDPLGWQKTLYGSAVHYIWLVYDFVGRNAASFEISTSVAFGIIFAVLTLTTLIAIGCCVARCGEELVLPMPKQTEKPKKAEQPKKEAPKKEEQKEETPKKEQPKAEKPKATSTLRQRKKRIE